MTSTPDISAQLRRHIAGRGEPIPVFDYMAVAAAAYYGERNPLGAAGDFTTAPEISQMFGELIGLWCADLWQQAGRPANVAYVELGPGRGTLAADALRAMRGAGLQPPVHFVEVSPSLRAAQRERVPDATWHLDTDRLPTDRPLLIVANEFFDALPVRQFVCAADGWRELVVEVQGDAFVRVPGPCAEPPRWASGPPGTVIEVCPGAPGVVQQLAERLERQGGAMLIVDYGHDRHAAGDTLQAVSRHAYADPWASPGAHDLTTHVDFQALIEAAPALRAFGPVGQGAFLRAMGIDLRARALIARAPARAVEIEGAKERLAGPEQMGRLFRVLGLIGTGWPDPEGFGTAAS